MTCMPIYIFSGSLTLDILSSGIVKTHCYCHDSPMLLNGGFMPPTGMIWKSDFFWGGGNSVFLVINVLRGAFISFIICSDDKMEKLFTSMVTLQILSFSHRPCTHQITVKFNMKKLAGSHLEQVPHSPFYAYNKYTHINKIYKILKI